MTNYNPNPKLTHKLAMVAATIVVGVGSLQWVAGAMTHPDPEAMALRQQVLAAQDGRAREIRALHNGEVRLATAGDGGTL
ncbi:MAG: hypothetical protein U1F10_16445 [Burkholderiales bacterium]